MKSITTNSAAETEQIGAALADYLKKTGEHRFVALYGDLGAGKTAFTRGFAGVLSPGSRVKSPTYTIVNEYRRGECPVFHFDLYRVSSSDELEGFGFEEYLDNGICISEWCENIGDMMPRNPIIIHITKLDENSREITIEGIDEHSFVL